MTGQLMIGKSAVASFQEEQWRIMDVPTPIYGFRHISSLKNGKQQLHRIDNGGRPTMMDMWAMVLPLSMLASEA